MKASPYSIVAIGLVLAVALGGVLFYADQQDVLPEGFVEGNGRLEAEQIEIAASLAGRVESVMVSEGSLVARNDLLVVMDTDELVATLDKALAEVALARQSKAEAQAVVIQRESERRRAKQELERATSLLASDNISETLFEERETSYEVAEAVLGAAQARVATAESRVAASEAETRRIKEQIQDSSLVAPAPGRILYRLAEPGEVVSAGAPILTLLSLEQVYMDIFLPARDAGLLPIGAEARVVLDALSEYAIPATVTFVSPEAQFTPKQVETVSEREQLVFRVRVRIPQELVKEHIAHVKTGVRGVAVVRLDERKAWPQEFERRIPPEFFE